MMNLQQVVLPRAVSRYYAAVDEGRFADLIDGLTEDVRFEVPIAGAAEVSPRNGFIGPDGVRRMLDARGILPITHVPVLAIDAGRGSWLIEGQAVSDETKEIVAHFFVHAEVVGDRLRRYVAHSTAAFPLGQDGWPVAGATAEAAVPATRWLAAIERAEHPDDTESVAITIAPEGVASFHDVASGTRIQRTGEAIRSALPLAGVDGCVHRILASGSFGSTSMSAGDVVDGDGRVAWRFGWRVSSSAGQVDRAIGFIARTAPVD